MNKGMKKRRPANAAFVLVLFAGCATTTTTYYRNALHPEYGQVQYDRDVYECRRENTGPVTSSYAYGYARVGVRQPPGGQRRDGAAMPSRSRLACRQCARRAE